MSSVEEPRVRRRRNVRGPVTLLVLLALLGGAAWYGATTVLGQRNTVVVGPPVCKTTKGAVGQKVTTKQVTVNVYNAGRTRGLAQRTAAALRTRGFNVATVANAPTGITAKKVRVRAAAKSGQAQLVAAQVKGPTLVIDKTKDSTIDLVLGTDFTKLRKKAPESITIPGGVTVCSTPTTTTRP
jgi:hypothetical protein